MTTSRRSPTWGRKDPPSLKGLADKQSLEVVFKALANEHRRTILAMLHDIGEYSGYMESHEIAERFDLPWQSISRHLRILTEARLISCDPRGKSRVYNLERDRLYDVAGRWVGRVATKGMRLSDGTLVFNFKD
jgi:DNA-binding transcriptional ArsR family regulator